MDRVRVAALQYFIRPVQRFEQFADQVEALIETAADYAQRLRILARRHPRRGAAEPGDVVIGELNLRTILDTRSTGTVIPLYDSRNTAQLVTEIEEVEL